MNLIAKVIKIEPFTGSIFDKNHPVFGNYHLDYDGNNKQRKNFTHYCTKINYCGEIIGSTDNNETFDKWWKGLDRRFMVFRNYYYPFVVELEGREFVVEPINGQLSIKDMDKLGNIPLIERTELRATLLENVLLCIELSIKLKDYEETEKQIERLKVQIEDYKKDFSKFNFC